MKVRIELDPDYITEIGYTAEKYYNEYHKDDKTSFNKEAQIIDYDVDLDFIPREGDRISCEFETCIVNYMMICIERKIVFITVCPE